MNRNLQQDAVERILDQGRKDPVLFIEETMKAQLWAGQRQIVKAVFENPRVCVKAAHSVGKTYVAARIVLAFFYLKPHCKILTTAPTYTAVRKLLWGEIATAYDRLPTGMGGRLFGTELRGSPDHWALGLSTDRADRFQGHHADSLLLVFDECAGVRSEIWEAAETIRAGGSDVHWLCIGNPTVTSGPFYDAFHTQRETWSLHTLGAFQTPNLAGIDPEDLLLMDEAELGADPYPFLTQRRWVRERAKEWGIGSPLFQSRVLGNFPTESEDSLIWLTHIEKARISNLQPKSDDDWRAGLDVAGPGSDETVLVVRNGPRIVSIKSWAGSDPRGQVVAELLQYRDRAIKVGVDSVGIGYYMAQHLRDNGFEVVEINVGKAPYDKERFTNLKGELYWGLRERFTEGEIAGQIDEGLISQLAGIRYGYDSRGRVVIESKDSIHRRGGKSPDRAEALMLAFGTSNALHWGPVDIRSEIVF